MGAWIIRAGRGGVYAEDWATRGIIGIGWDLGGADIAAMPKDAIRQAYADCTPARAAARWRPPSAGRPTSRTTWARA